ncbi:MAG TPA: von Willebrand factor type A domain-containing protein [Thermoanaerobaculia bacterium]|nr:von Willebrand factor type A domain-containing protein [Thermoanaerobaculia bacterium]
MNPKKIDVDVEDMLSRTPAPAPPDGLLEKLKSEIPTELPKPLAVASRPPVRTGYWMKAAAAVLLAGVAALIGYRVTVDSEPSKVVAKPPAVVPAEKRTRVTEGGPSGSEVRTETVVPPGSIPVRKPAPAAKAGGPATIEVRARDESGSALPGVTVRVQGDGVDKLTTTDARGRAQVEVPKEGPYRVESELSGFDKKVEEARAVAGKKNEVETKMKTSAIQSAVTVSAEAPVLVEGGVPANVAGGVLASAPGRPTVMPPSTGGTREPNDAPYGDVFFKEYGTNPFVDTDDDKLSTFGLDVDTGSYTVARRYINDGNLPPREAIRVEEFVNAFFYGDGPPARGDFAIRAEAAPTPFMKGDLYRVVRFNVRGRAVDAKDRKPAVLTFVVDVSGSMQYENRLELVKRALGLLLDQLDSSDRVGLVTYGSTAQTVLRPTSDKESIREAIGRLYPGGATNAEEGLRVGYEVAAQFRRSDGINRVILCSDGVANVGRTGPDSILRVIERQAKENDIELTTVGFGMGNYNDVLMEQLANKGDGRYAYVDTIEEARRIFVEELSGTLQTIATDAKAQVEFEPSVVSRWRLLGYENRDVADERFRDDTVDAGEIGAGHSVTALYEIKLKDDAPRRGTAATLRLRYRSKETGRVVELEHDLRLSDFADSWNSAPRGLKLASLVAEFAELLKGNYWAKDGNVSDVLTRARRVAAELPGDRRANEFVAVVERVAGIGLPRSGSRERDE